MKKTLPSSATVLLPPSLRRYLYLTAAISGAAILVVEILGAKMLAPYLGTSHFVWTAQIAVTMIALAAGYYLGGWLVDRSGKLTRLYACILLAAIYLCAGIPLVEWLTYACLRFKLAVGALLASGALFFVPLTLLATTGPFLIRVLTTSVNQVGGQAGRLSAISTLGSVFGTVLIGYVLIPLFPNSFTLYLTSAALMLLSAVYFLAWGRKAKQQAGVVFGILIGLSAGYVGVRLDSQRRYMDVEELVRVNSNFGLLQVLQSKDTSRRFYLNDFLLQNTYDPVARKSTSAFTEVLHELARSCTPRIDDVLCIGLGVGIVPMKFAREGARVDVVEINPTVIAVATNYFHLEPERLNLAIDDGRHFLNRTPRKYDTVILDAFLGDSSPSHLFTQEAFTAVQKTLKPGGTLVINSFGHFETGHDFFTASLDKTLRAVFRSVRIHSSGSGNVYFIASDQAGLKLLHPPNLDAVHDAVRQQVEAALSGIRQTDPQHGRVLTDDYNPMEFYDAANREELRRSLAIAVRRL